MATDALDPTHPTGANQVEVSSELRGIKTRLVADKAAIETLQTQIAPLTGAGATGLVLLDANDDDDAFDALAVTALGKSIVQDYDDLASLKSFLGIVGAVSETVTTTTNKGTIEWAGGLKLKWTIDSVPPAGLAVTWDTPFDSTVLFGGTLAHGGSEAGWVNAPLTVTGTGVDHNNGSSKTMHTFALGF